MADNNDEWYLEGAKPSLRTWIFGQMAVGAGWGALVFFGVVFFIFILIAIGSRLPTDPFAMIETTTALTAFV